MASLVHVPHDTGPFSSMLDGASHQVEHSEHSTSYSPPSSHDSQLRRSASVDQYHGTYLGVSTISDPGSGSVSPSSSRVEQHGDIASQPVGQDSAVPVEAPRNPFLHPSPQPAPTASISPQVGATESITSFRAPSSTSDNISSSAGEGGAESPSRRVKVRDLQDIQTFAKQDPKAFGSIQDGSNQETSQPTQYEISQMPVTDVIEMVAGLLTKITETNDTQAEHLHKQIPSLESATGLSLQSSNVLAFHGKNVPAISILSYLGRIHKYCPATYEVFLSLLVYFDRITEKINSASVSMAAQTVQGPRDQVSKPVTGSAPSSPLEPMHQPNVDAAGDHATAPSPSSPTVARSFSDESDNEGAQQQLTADPSDPFNLINFFVVDSYNIHRLIIAGVTCASKFFSDVFYTNSRYAKVGGCEKFLSVECWR